MASLTLYDLTGIQNYIFSSNKLADIVGASYLVQSAIEDLLFAAVAGLEGADVVWWGGGNALVRTVDGHQAREVAQRWSAQLFAVSPGLNGVCVHAEPKAGEDYVDLRARMRAALFIKKGAYLPVEPWDGRGVVAPCAVTGWPAVAFQKEPVSASVKARRGAVAAATQRMTDMYPLTKGRIYTNQLDRLGRSEGERSLIAVVHIDGNAMGKRFDDTTGKEEEMKLSEATRRVGQDALQGTLEWLDARLPELARVHAGGFALYQADESDRECFPVRPVVFGGDDTTLVCDGRIAFDLTAEYLRRWVKATEAEPAFGGPAHACAGIALLHVHAPVVWGAQLAQELCKGVKKVVTQSGRDGSGFDYEILGDGQAGSVSARREQADYRDPNGNLLHGRPLWVHRPTSSSPGFDWVWFRDELCVSLRERFTGNGRNQLKRFVALLSRDREERERHYNRMKALGLELPPLPGATEGSLFVGTQNQTPYADAVELMDRMVPRTLLDLPKAGDA